MHDDVKDLFKEKGLRITPQRLEIWNIVKKMDTHPATEDVFELVRKRFSNISFDTVYRTLTLFEKFGIIKKVHYFTNRTLYDTNLAPHHHFVCMRCRKIIDFTWEDMDNTDIPEYVKSMGKPDSIYVEIRGICKECLKKESRSKSKKKLKSQT